MGWKSGCSKLDIGDLKLLESRFFSKLGVLGWESGNAPEKLRVGPGHQCELSTGSTVSASVVSGRFDGEQCVSHVRFDRIEGRTGSK